MAYCSYCGKEIEEESSFCSYCGKSVTENKEIKKESDAPHEEKVNVKKIVIPIFLGIFLVGLIATISLYSSSKGSNSQGGDTDILLTEEKTIDFSKITPGIKSSYGERKEGYAADEKPFESGDYSYDERTADFRLVCKNPCPVSKEVLDQEFAAISYAVSTLRGLTQSDINEELMPFEVHATEDNRCTLNKSAWAAYKTSFVDSNGYKRGLLCFFYDEIEYNRDEFPYSTSVHEVTHLFQDGKLEHNNYIIEGMAVMMESFFLKGNEKDSFCWRGNAWYKEYLLQNPNTLHGGYAGGELFFQLCNQYGFDYDDLPELFRQLEMRNGEVDEKEFIQILNDIVNADTTHLFKDAGVVE